MTRRATARRWVPSNRLPGISWIISMKGSMELILLSISWFPSSPPDSLTAWFSMRGPALLACRQVRGCGPQYFGSPVIITVPGNTIFAALGLSGQPRIVHPNAYLKSLTSILAFCVGTLFFSAFHRLPCWSDPNPAPSRRRFILVGSFTIQTVFIIIAAILVKLGLVSNRPSVAGAFSSGNHLSPLPNPEEEDNYKDLIAIALLAFQSAGPVFFSRVVGIIELPTIVLSTLYCDFVADLYRLPQSLRNKTSWYTLFLNDERRQFRRLGSIIMLFLGGMVGGVMFRSSVGMIGAFWLAAGLKGLLVLGWIFWETEKREQEESDVWTLTVNTCLSLASSITTSAGESANFYSGSLIDCPMPPSLVILYETTNWCRLEQSLPRIKRPSPKSISWIFFPCVWTWRIKVTKNDSYVSLRVSLRVSLSKSQDRIWRWSYRQNLALQDDKQSRKID